MSHKVTLEVFVSETMTLPRLTVNSIPSGMGDSYLEDGTPGDAEQLEHVIRETREFARTLTRGAEQEKRP